MAGATVLRQMGLPGQLFFDDLVKTAAKTLCPDQPQGPPGIDVMDFYEDNQAMISVCMSGRNPTMRHMGRTHGVSLAWMNDEVHKTTLDMGYCPSEQQAADIFTKFFPQGKRVAWHISRKLINVLSPAEIEEMSGTPGGGWNHKHGDGDKDPVQNASMAVTPDDPLGRLAVTASAKRWSLNRLKDHMCPRKNSSIRRDTARSLSRGRMACRQDCCE